MFVGMESSHKEAHPVRKSYRTKAEAELWDSQLTEEIEHQGHR